MQERVKKIQDHVFLLNQNQMQIFVHVWGKNSADKIFHLAEFSTQLFIIYLLFINRQGIGQLRMFFLAYFPFVSYYI